MKTLGFDLDVSRLPTPWDTDAAERERARWLDAIRETDDSQLARTAESVTDDDDARALVDALFGNAPFLAHCARRAPETLVGVLTRGPDAVMADILAETDGLRGTAQADDDLKRALRLLKTRAALCVAAADVAGVWSVAQVTRALSDFADATLQTAAAHVLRRAAEKGAFHLPDPDAPWAGSGFVCLGMGKLGARELNYSSDVDLVMLFDAERIETRDRHGLQRRFTRIARDIAALMSDRTVDGYVFRTDLRLRPDPGATPLCVSMAAAEIYYESQGQNWERAAYIKARPVAGDLDLGAQFIRHLRPFVWRRSLDFYAIQDIHSIKRQINAKRGGSTERVAGHNIKLGRGGIREIEFFAQIQQLIWGGRNPALRAPATPDALAALCDADLISEKERGELFDAYVFLRTLEHRLQMRNDEQTQTLPDTDDGLAAMAAFMGFPDRSAFEDTLLGHLRRVEHHYAELFEDQPSLGAGDGGGGADGSEGGGADAGSLVFTGSEPEPETLATLATLGFGDGETVHAIIRGWHHGRYRAMRTTRARELLTEITPALLRALGATPDPDSAFRAFDQFLEALPAGVQLFAMFQTNPQLLDFMADVMGEAPRLAQALARAPQMMDGLLSAEFMAPPPKLNVLARELARALSQAAPLAEGGFEDVLTLSRRWVHERQFQIGVQTLQGAIEPFEAAWALSRIAEAALSRLQAAVEATFAARGHGRVPGGGFTALGYGKLGGHELTPQSDLDLVFVFDADPDAKQSDGSKPLSPSHYYARLGQRFINAVTTMTPEGGLYEVDMRLRPSGKSGPLAVSLEAFERYYRDDAWTWEMMALTRARPVTGPHEARRAVAAAVRRILCRPRDADALGAEVAAMRARIRAEHGTDNAWAVKHRKGGLVDIEFIAQFLQLRDAHDRPEVLSANTFGALRALHAAGRLSDDHADILMRGLDLWQRVQSVLHLTLDKDLRIADAAALPKALAQQLSRLGGVATTAELEGLMDETAAAVHRVHVDIVGEAAADG
jgi:glutamate-ammonia-ligase adenylyltransferase